MNEIKTRQVLRMIKGGKAAQNSTRMTTITITAVLYYTEQECISAQTASHLIRCCCCCCCRCCCCCCSYCCVGAGGAGDGAASKPPSRHDMAWHGMFRRVAISAGNSWLESALRPLLMLLLRYNTIIKRRLTCYASVKLKNIFATYNTSTITEDKKRQELCPAGLGRTRQDCMTTGNNCMSNIEQTVVIK